MIRRRTIAIDTARATWQIVGALLRYPDAELVAALPSIHRAVIDERIPHSHDIAELVDVWRSLPIGDLQARYVERFDMHRACSLDMSWHQFGDRRQRGLVLLNLVQTYQRHGFGPASGDLPDWLPLMLEFAADAPGGAGRDLLVDWRTAIELVRRELGEMRAPEVVLFDALSATLGPVDRGLIATVERLLADGPPGEDVGLQPFGPSIDNEQPMMPPASTCAAGELS